MRYISQSRAGDRAREDKIGASGPWLAMLALALIGACSKPPTLPPLATRDPALDLYLRAQPAQYGGIAQWAHQFMLVDEAVARLSSQGFDCPAPAPAAATRSCERRDSRSWRNLFGTIRSERVVITLKHPGPRIAKIEGMRYGDTPQGPIYSDSLAAPGLSFRDARGLADFILDAHADWHPRKYCFPAAAQRGCDDELKARGENGWRRWDGKTPVIIGTASDSLHSLREAGYGCRSAEGIQRSRTDGLPYEDGHAWVDCSATSLDGQAQRIRLGLNATTAQLEVLRVSAGSDTVDVPVAR